MADDESSELSSLSSLSPAPSDDESDIQLKPQNGILRFFHKVPKPTSQPAEEMSPPPKREPSPPHEYVLADNPDIAFIVEFRKRFDQHLGRTPNFGPLEVENDVVGTVPGERLENFLCTILRVLLNRKQDVKPGHYHRALEDAIKFYNKEWPRKWEGKNPLAGGVTFASMNPEERLALMRTLIYWALEKAPQVHTVLDIANKRGRDRIKDYNVEPIGSDSDKRRYFLVQGLDDNSFRVYRESNPAGHKRTWWSVAGSIDELKALAGKLETADRGPKARALAKELLRKVPEFEESEEKRKRREYRRMQKDRFKRPEPGFSLYEGRTRGKRVKYTYSDDEDFLTDSTNRRSTRNTRNHTPTEATGPVFTASGRQSRRPNRLTAETLSNGDASAPPSVQGDQPVDSAVDTDMNDEGSVGPTGRPRRSAAVNHGLNGWAAKKRRSDYISDDDDEETEPDFGDDEEDEHVPDDSDEDAEEFEDADLEANDEVELDDSPQSRIVKLHIKVDIDNKGKAMSAEGKPDEAEKAAKGQTAVAPTSQPAVPGTAPEASTGMTERTGDVVNVAVSQQAPVTMTTAEGPASREPAAPPSMAQPSVEHVMVTPKQDHPPTPSGSASLAFRAGDDNKPQHTPRPINV